MPYTNELKEKIHELNSQMSEECTSVGYGFKEKDGKITKEKSIIFTFRQKKPLSELSPDEIIPDNITVGDEILKTDVRQGVNKFVAYEKCPSEFYFWSSDTSLNPTGATTPTQQNTIRPIKGGLQIINQSKSWLGTMGFVAVDNDTTSLVGVTNAHVMTEVFFKADESSRKIENVYGDTMGQPDTNSSNSVGVTKRYVPIQSSKTGVNYVDGAIFTLDSSDVDIGESFKYYGLSFSGAPEFATTREIDELIDNDWDLYSVGRTTGAKGEGKTKLKFLSYDNVNVYNTLNDSVDRLCTFNDCISYIASASTTTTGDACFYPINSGDSGSALLADINGRLKIIGLSFAGTDLGEPDDYFRIARACRIDRVAEELNISPFTGQTINYSDINNPKIHYEIGFSSLSAVTINGDKYYQLGTLS